MRVTGAARVAGLIGWPVRHALSPTLHGHWLERCGVDGAYVPLPVSPEHVELAFEALPRLGFLGWNVTVPHKETAFRLVDARDPAAARMGAVNTVLVRPDGTLLGCNTDAPEFLSALDEQAPGWRANPGPVVVLGAGGGARAVTWALLDAGAKGLRLSNRSPERAQVLAAELGAAASVPVEAVPWAARSAALAGAALLVNTTSLGMAGQPPLEIALGALPRASPVADLVYVPLETALLAAARERGHPTVDGLGMLIRQAVPGFRHWGGREPPLDDAVRACLLEVLAPR